ncbi:hypothetical protein OEZ86_009810 [Tetradesmus obliquus]|uniref:THH1/TOM1/TOM3 domain-containing protein n=1 Tax=Tetradesmus obliquus TaxID=3088 RepID=A0ABY8UPI1_TETOB|nr:hypothetical protein OEZ85_001251 [Tetradesmus obliquus]WIA43311.1 hypothetical protein OEZ86_009810 [Tetradesmus obliquus]
MDGLQLWQWAVWCTSLSVGVAQGALLLACHQAYLRHRLPIIVLRRLSAVALFCYCLQLALRDVEHPGPNSSSSRSSSSSSSSSDAWAIARLLLAHSAALINLVYVLWFRTVSVHCFLLNMATMALVLRTAPAVCASALAGGTAGPQAMLLHIAKPFQYLSVPWGLDWDPSASNAACVPDPSAAGLTAAAGGTCSAFKAAQVHN